MVEKRGERTERQREEKQRLRGRDRKMEGRERERERGGERDRRKTIKRYLKLIWIKHHVTNFHHTASCTAFPQLPYPYGNKPPQPSQKPY